MKILVINAGSSSLKYQLIDMENEQVLAKGLCERIGIGGEITHKTHDGRVVKHEADFPTHTEAFQELVKLMTSGEGKVIDDMSEIAAVGQRTVHGGEKFSGSVLIDSEVLAKIEECSELAPLHNPAAILAIKACEKVFGGKVPQVAVFDTAFHQTMPEKAYIFGLPYEYYEKYHIRRYGFHGTSHRFVSARFFEITGMKPEGSKLITCHLGNGSSISAIKDGKCMDTSMGFTPLDGFIMGTRSGGIDPSVLTYIMEKENLSPKAMSDIMNKKSGLLGISGVSSDKRDIGAAAAEGNQRAKLANELLNYQIKKFVGSYAAAMGGVDAIIFTGGIGENDDTVRAGVCSDMEFMGVELNRSANDGMRGEEKKISTDSSKVQVWVIPTNEELLIARDTRDLVK
ncbi:MAG: acetate kinase [Oscillospiraceae bacterium]|nr:acetate kinase [Oscillospiraceae bacterium]MCI9364269.1 acetate kinase [Oscillospiraceae bacterium]RKJ54321.1 acetate kinase [bacterium 1XD42-8]RKJ63344.1 acetate kinase [bacterium 1XD42-1]